MKRAYSVFKPVMVPVFAACAMFWQVLPVSADTNILVHIFAPPQYPNNSAGWVFLKENVERETQGRVTFEFTNGAVAPPRQNIALVQDGAVDAAYLNSGLNRAQWRLPEIGRLPFEAPSAEAVSVANWRTYEKYFKQADEFSSLKLVSIYSYAGEQAWTINKPISKFEDFKGMKVRTAAGLGAGVAEAMGLTPVPSLAAEVFPLASKGVVDGVFGAGAFIDIVKVSQFLKHGVHFPGALNNLVFIAFMNEQKWDEISPADQAIFDKYAGETMARSVGREWDRLEKKALETMKENGTSIVEASPEMMAKTKAALGKFEAEWIKDAMAKGVDAKAALSFFREQAALVQKEKTTQ